MLTSDQPRPRGQYAIALLRGGLISAQMEDKIGLLSLRKKRSVRPKISNPRPTISAPTVTSLPPAAERPAIALQGARELRKAPEDAENTAEYVKRRYSTRVHALPPILTDAPTLPTIPDQYDSNQSLPLEEQRRRSIHAPVATPQSLRSPTEKIDVNFRALQDPDLRAEQCKLISYKSLTETIR